MSTPAPDQQPTRIRWRIVLLLFAITSINYADRATISIAGTDLAHDLNLDPVALGYLLSAFSVSYVALQIPGGWLLDHFGSRLVYLLEHDGGEVLGELIERTEWPMVLQQVFLHPRSDEVLLHLPGQGLVPPARDGLELI